ncbi:MAG: hypothetical protein AAFQ98_12005 [Bacteroidota bacterium]
MKSKPLALLGLLSSLLILPMIASGQDAATPVTIITLTPLTDNPKHEVVELKEGDNIFVQIGDKRKRTSGKLQALVDGNLVLKHPIWGERFVAMHEVTVIGQKNIFHTIGRVVAFPFLGYGSVLAVLGAASFLANPEDPYAPIGLAIGGLGVLMAAPASVPYWIPRKKYSRAEWDFIIDP